MIYTGVMVEEDEKPYEGSLAGQLLVATPSLQESCFSRSVIYLCAHNEAGAMGVIVNAAALPAGFLTVRRELASVV